MTLLKTSNDNFPLKNGEKDKIIEKAADAYGKYLDALGFDWRNDPNSNQTPLRVAKSFVNELASGCYDFEPKITTFDNTCNYDGMIFQGNIDVKSLCAHHHLPFTGKAHVAYIPNNGKIIGLSKLNRIVNFYSQRPQVQENLTMQIHDHIKKAIENPLGTAVVIEAGHMCVSCRGIKQDSIMKTSKLSGVFMDNSNLARSEFFNFIKTLQGN